MSRVIELTNKYTHLRLQPLETTVLRNGREAQSAYISYEDLKFRFLLIEVPEFIEMNRIRDIVQLAEFERVIIYTSHLLPDQMKDLRNNKIGYVDDHGNYSIALEFMSDPQDRIGEEKAKELKRSTNFINEFFIGFLFYKNFGLLEISQAEIGNIIRKSPATVNLNLKKMEQEGVIVKIKRGYYLANFENYFARWRFLLSQYKVKKEYARYTSGLTNDELKDFVHMNKCQGDWALSGPRIESVKDDGHLDNVEGISIFTEEKYPKNVMKELKLVPKTDGEVAIYSFSIDLRDDGQFAHEIVLCGELVNSNMSRIREAGERRFQKYKEKVKRVINERFDGKGF